MSDQQLLSRCGDKCELCCVSTPLVSYEVPASSGQSDVDIMLCSSCLDQINGELNVNHWRCLNDSMWSQVPAVQVMAWRLLKRLDSESWARDLLDMMYLEDDTQVWAQAVFVDHDDSAVIHKDCNGVDLAAGDTVVITKDLNVKGTSFTAKRGTAVRGISLTDNPEHIEGRVNGTRIVIFDLLCQKSLMSLCRACEVAEFNQFNI